VYQDFYYTFDPSLEFDEIARFGFKTDLPIVTPNNLLQYNSPHNAPMWRKKLHEQVGLFDVSFRSAGDWDFWIRCISKGKQFFKVAPAHIAYFQNPEGISTRPDTRGRDEAFRILRKHGRRVISPLLLMSREAFAEAIGGADRWTKKPYYDVVQARLVELGASGKVEAASLTA
jgi:hypothetical protein